MHDPARARLAVSAIAASADGALTATSAFAGSERCATPVLSAKPLGKPGKAKLAIDVESSDAPSAGSCAAGVFWARIFGTDAARPAVVLLADAHLTVADSFKGRDLDETAQQVTARLASEETSGIAIGEKFADALTGAAAFTDAAPLAGAATLADAAALTGAAPLTASSGPLLFTAAAALAAPTTTASQALAPITTTPITGVPGLVTALGGPTAVSDTALSQVATTTRSRMA